MSAPAWERHLAGDPPPAWTPVAAEDSLARAWGRRWSEQPAASALVDLSGEDEISYTRAQLAERSGHAAALLHAGGVRAGDRVLFSGAPSAAYLFLYVGAVRMGAVVVPANTAYMADELAHIVADATPVLAVLDDPARLAAEHAALPTIVPAPDLLDERADSAEAPSLDAARAEDLAMIAYTSGTTGRPKGAMLSHRNLLASARAVVESWRWTSADGLVLALPLFHMHGLGVGVHGSLVAGGRILLLPGFRAEAVARACARGDATMLFGVPTMHKRLAELAEREERARLALGSLRLVVSGSAPLSDKLWQRFAELTGQRILERYGMTETVMSISNPYEGERRPGTVGIPLPGVEIRLDGPEPDAGEIVVRGQNVLCGYWNRPAATAESFTDDGWFKSGDVGERSPDGYIAIVGRSKELIISGGYNVYPREVEEALEAHPAVREAAVMGRPSDEWGETVVAFVALEASAGQTGDEELAAFAAARLANYKRPRELRRLDAVPRNALGKIDRARLAALL